MKRILTFIILGVLLLATVCATTASAAARPSVHTTPPTYVSKVTSDAGTFAGTLVATTANGVVPTYSFHGSTRFTPGTTYYLYYSTQTGRHDVGSAVANQRGIVSVNGVWQNPVADLQARPPFVLSTQAPNSGGLGPYELSVGEDAVWGKAVAYNFHQAYAEGLNTHEESSSGNDLSTKVAVPSGAHSEYSYARLGVVFHIEGVTTQAQWNAIKDRPVKVGANVASYDAGATGDVKSEHFTFISLVSGSPPGPGAIVLDQRDTGTWTGHSAPVVTTTLGALDAQDGTPGDCIVVMNVWCGVSNVRTAGAAEHHNGATISDMQLTWL